MEQTDCSETSAYKLQTPGNYPKESIQHLEHGESLKSRMNARSFVRLPLVDNQRHFICGIKIVQIKLVIAAHDKYTLWTVQVYGS
jgi:hypothetical protein